MLWPPGPEWVALLLGYLVILAMPGPNLFVVGTAATLHGAPAALLAGLGVASGIAALGAVVMLLADAALSQPAAAPGLGQAVSGAILLWLGWRFARDGRARPNPPTVRGRGLVLAGFCTAATNPVTAAFFAAQGLGPFAGFGLGARALAAGLVSAQAFLWLLAVGLLLARFAADRRLDRLPLRPLRLAAAAAMVAMAAVTLQPLVATAKAALAP